MESTGRNLLSGGSKRASGPPRPGPRPTPGAVAKLKTGIEIIYTFNLLDPNDFTQNSSVAVKKGYNWDVVVDAVRARITARGGMQGEIVETATTVAFTGESVFDVCSIGFDVIWLGAHSPPKEHIAQIRARCTKQVEIVIGFFNFESITQYPAFHNVVRELDAYQFTKLIETDDPNVFGCYVIDKFETDSGPSACPPARPATFGKHTLDVRIDTPGIVDGWCDLLIGPVQDAWHQNYLVGGNLVIDGIVVDNLLSNPFKGIASNEYPDDWGTAPYLGAKGTGQDDAGGSGQMGMLYRLRALAALGFTIWGNAGDQLTTYSSADLNRRFVEHWFRKYVGPGFTKRTLGELQFSIDAMRAADVKMIVGGLDGPGIITAWFTSPGPGGVYGTWSDIQAKVVSADALQHFVVESCRTTGGGYLYWQPEFAIPE